MIPHPIHDRLSSDRSISGLSVSNQNIQTKRDHPCHKNQSARFDVIVQTEGLGSSNSEASIINRGKGRDKHKGKKPKLTFKELLAKYQTENEAKCANRPNNVKHSRNKGKSKDWNWQGEEFHTATSYPPFSLPMTMTYGSTPASVHPYSSWGWYGPRAHPPSYFRPPHLECEAPTRPTLNT